MTRNLTVALFLAATSFAQEKEPDLDAAALFGCYDATSLDARAIEQIKARDEGSSGFALYMAYAWKKDRLTVTFEEGEEGISDKVKGRIAEILQEWNAVSRIKFVPSSEPFNKGDIRVACRKKEGNHSAIGRLSARGSKDAPSMNLATCATWPVGSREFKRVVLHEFGHALGFAHEHQSPNDSCASEIKLDEAYAYYGREQGWSKEQVNRNLGTIKDRSGMKFSAEGDKDSIMRYYLSPKVLINGKKSPCYIGEPKYELSQKDKEGAERLTTEGSGYGPADFDRVYSMRTKSGISEATAKQIAEWKLYWEGN